MYHITDYIYIYINDVKWENEMKKKSRPYNFELEYILYFRFYNIFFKKRCFIIKQLIKLFIK